MCVYSCLMTSAVLIFSLMTSVVETCNGPFINPPHLLVKYGDPAWANCSTDQPEIMGWQSPVKAIDAVYQAHLTWEVESLTDWILAKGVQCYTVSDVHGQCLGNLSITIYKPPARVSIRLLSNVSEFVEGQPFQLECLVQDVAPVSHLKVTWFKGQHKLTLSANVENVEGKTSENVTVTERMELTAGREDHGAQYRCEAELEIEGLQPHPVKSSNSLGISVSFVPVINCPSKVQVQENERLSNCTAEGNPSPEVTWFKGHQQVDPLSPLSRLNGGQYTVYARNSVGRVNQIVDIDILYGPEINCPRKLEVIENEVLKGCTVRGNPLPEVTWYRGDPKSNPAFRKFNHTGKLGRMDGGIYTVFAESKPYASVHRTVEVVIVSKGNNISMSCGCVLLVLLFSHIFH